MKKTVKSKLIISKNGRHSMLISTEKGLLNVQHDMDIMIIKTEREDLFKREVNILLKKNITLVVNHVRIFIPEGIMGKLHHKLVFFRVDDSFIGLNSKRLNGNIDYILPC